MSMRKFPYGYAMEKGKIIVNDAEAEIIRKIFMGRADGKSNWQMAKELYNAGIPYFSDDKKKSSCKISSILYDPRYIGADGYPAILDHELFDKVQSFRGKPYREQQKQRVIAGRNQIEPASKKLNTTIFIPNQAVLSAEKELKAAMRSENVDTTDIRSRILNLASLKYDCIQ